MMVHCLQAADVFSPLVVARESQYEGHAHQVLTSLLDSIPADQLAPSPGSTATLSSMHYPSKCFPKKTFTTNSHLDAYCYMLGGCRVCGIHNITGNDPISSQQKPVSNKTLSQHMLNDTLSQTYDFVI